jgi:hypothetical protein
MKLQGSESWPKTTGMIIESTIKSEWAKAGSDRIYVVKPKVAYEYQVDGKRHASSHLALVEFNTANENSARKKSEKYHVGQQVTVYYNPRKPDFATLEIGDPTGGKLPTGIMGFGILLAVSGIIWLLVEHVKL